MPWYSLKSHGGYHFSVCIDDRNDIVVESHTCNDDDDDDVVFIKNSNNNNNKPQQPFGRYHAMLKREQEWHLDTDFFDLYLVDQNKEENHCGLNLGDAELFNRKKEEDCHRRILDKNSSSSEDDDERDDCAFIVVDADAALLGQQASAPVEASFSAVRVQFVNDGSTRASVSNLAPNDDGHVKNLLEYCARSLVAGCEEESVADEILHDEVLFGLFDWYNNSL
jgi:hypothetical protein